MELIVDTTLLVGIWRGQPWAVSFARANKRSMGFPCLAVGLPLMDTELVVPVYAELCSRLQDKSFYKGIGQNDLWIAAVSLAFDKPLVTRNRRHFDKIDELKLEVLVP